MKHRTLSAVNFAPLKLMGFTVDRHDTIGLHNEIGSGEICLDMQYAYIFNMHTYAICLHMQYAMEK